MLRVWAPLWMMMRFILGPCLCSQRNTELAGGLIWWFVFQNQSKEADSASIAKSLDQLKVDFVSQVGKFFKGSASWITARPNSSWRLESKMRKFAKKKKANRDSKLTGLIWNEHCAPASRFPLAFVWWFAPSVSSVVCGNHGWPTSSRPGLTLVNSHFGFCTGEWKHDFQVLFVHSLKHLARFVLVD